MYSSYKEFQQGYSPSKNMTLHATSICCDFLKLCQTMINRILPNHSYTALFTRIKPCPINQEKEKTQPIRNVHDHSNFFSQSVHVTEIQWLGSRWLGQWQGILVVSDKNHATVSASPHIVPHSHRLLAVDPLSYVALICTSLIFICMSLKKFIS